MSILTYYDKITAFQDHNNSRLNTWLNHLVVIFAFLLPISNSGRASAAFIIYLLFLVRGKYAYYLRSAIKDRLVQAFLLYFLVHAVWLIGTENFVEATKVMGQAKYLLYPLLLATIVDKKFIPRIFAAFLPIPLPCFTIPITDSCLR
jgi:O-antigen ligase